MCIISDINYYENLPKAYNGCTCECHRFPGILHVAACCTPITNVNSEYCELNLLDNVNTNNDRDDNNK